MNPGLKHKVNRVLKVHGHNLYWFQDRLKRTIFYRKRIKKWMKNQPNISAIKKDKTYLAESKKFLAEHFHGYRNTNWHMYYAAFNGLKDKRYLPEDYFFNRIEPALNNFALCKAFADKNSYDNFIDQSHLPKVLCKIVNGEYFDNIHARIPENERFERLLDHHGELVLKPAIVSGQGRNVVIGSPGEIVKRLQSGNYQHFSYIIQEKIQQHSQLSAFHPSSVNTYRITTARINKGIVVLSAYFRIGRNRSVIDNGMAGGMMCGIDKEGRITDYAYDMKLKKMYRHPDTHLPFQNFVCPAYRDACNFCTETHHRLLHFTLVSWDIAIDATGKPVCIEMNLKNQSITGHQLVHGPLFGEYTGELLEQFAANNGKNLLYF